jgi:hypothetical protein
MHLGMLVTGFQMQTLFVSLCIQNEEVVEIALALKKD